MQRPVRRAPPAPPPPGSRPRPAPAAPAPARLERVVAAYDAHLRDAAGLADATRLYRRRYAREFLTAAFGTRPIRWARLRSVHVREFVAGYGRTPWLAWADLYAGEWTLPQFAHIWEGCNRVRFFRVRERTGEVLHCVTRVHWAQEMSYSNFLAESEGGSPVTVWYDPAAADREVKQALAAEEMASAVVTVGEGELLFDPRPRWAAASPFAEVPPADPLDVRDAVHCEVVAVERGDPAERLAGTAFVVVRLGWGGLFRDDGNDNSGEVPGLFDRREGDGGVPVRVFAKREDAEHLRDTLEAEYRAFANPFALWLPGVRGFGWESDHGVRVIREMGVSPAPDDAPADDPHTARRVTPAGWWARVGDRLTDAQRAALWELNWDYSRQHALYAVHEVRVGDGGTRPPRRVRTMYYVRATTRVPGGGPGHNPHRFLGAFADRPRAEAVRDEAERTFRESPPPDQQPPVPCEPDGSWDWYSSMTEHEASRHLHAHGLTVNDRHPSIIWTADWWHASPQRPFRPAQLRAVWEVFDRVRLYEVLALPTEVAD